MHKVIEAGYPISFREEQAKQLGVHIRNHDSVVIIGMKRVGISNFLRFFLNHEKVIKTYIENGTHHLFVPIDLNDLVERTAFPFWTLTLKRIVDTIESSTLPDDVKIQARRYFTESIQLHDLFFTIDSVHKVANSALAAGWYPTLFFIRFDRIRDAITPEFFANLQGLKDAAKQKLSYVFTSYRPLSELAPNVFTKSALSVFSKDMYVPPARNEDMTSILETFRGRYRLELNKDIQNSLIAAAAGHVQYLQLSLIRLNEEKIIPGNKAALFSLLAKDEQILLQSEELFESLTKAEQDVLIKLKEGESIDDTLSKKASYLWDTGILTTNGTLSSIFSPFLSDYVGRISAPRAAVGDLTRKENLLFTYLRNNEGLLCEREDIIEAVWPESKELGVTDWAIDRLVARVRSKLKASKMNYEIVTVITRGYKLISSVAK